MNPSADQILDRLIKARKAAGLSQGQVAKLLGLSGTASSVSQWERGGRGLDIQRLIELCDLYGVSVVWVISGRNPEFDITQLMTATRANEIIDQLKAILEPLVKQP